MTEMLDKLLYFKNMASQFVVNAVDEQLITYDNSKVPSYQLMDKLAEKLMRLLGAMYVKGLDRALEDETFKEQSFKKDAMKW